MVKTGSKMKTKQEIEEEAEKFAKDWEGFALVREGMKDGFIAGAKFMQAYADQQRKAVLDEAIGSICKLKDQFGIPYHDESMDKTLQILESLKIKQP